MAYSSNLFTTPFAIIKDYWNRYKTICNQSVNNYYNQRIELDPEGEAKQYWQRLNHPQSCINMREINDAMLSRFMQSLLEQGISKFAVDQFILELRRLQRTHNKSSGFN